MRDCPLIKPSKMLLHECNENISIDLNTFPKTKIHSFMLLPPVHIVLEMKVEELGILLT